MKAKKTAFERSLKVVTNTLKSEPEFFMTYQANIAMAFYDAYQGARKTNKYISNFLLRHIANQAAKNFLNLWCK